ncbi:hypothetical protein AGDE_03976 [Angomonas deanei]|uniref:Ankyrin repeats (3 copies) n=1 Tax=Angomonas deanei TaxID=59799 RepID=A0A7G2C824_9TRYP|nr:hypothetical protein AGDE_03976 [Angomonas deanei]CAD2215896.1 hypothetical protein, conserved [Angomonas deanei]|eukprot:EPY39952.1 hypothetical protein AGDE_03976 [Angomonas deanei]
MTANKAFSAKLHRLLLNDQEGLKSIFSDSDFKSVNIENGVFIDLIERSLPNDIIAPFVNVADDEQLSLLVSLIVLYSNVYPLENVFAHMKKKEEMIEKHKLKALFMTACDRGDLTAIRSLVENKCYDPNDTRPLVVICRNEMNKTVINQDLIKYIFEVFPKAQDDVKYLLQDCVPLAKHEQTKTAMKELLNQYLS